MKSYIFLFISFFFLTKTNCQENTKLLPVSPDMPYQVPADNEVIKPYGKNATDVVLRIPQTFVIRNQEITVLSSVIKESGNYLIMYKVTGEDTNTFYPYRYQLRPTDSAATYFLQINHQNETEIHQFLNRQEFYSDSMDHTISFVPIDNQFSVLRSLNANDTLSLAVKFYASPGIIMAEKERDLNIDAAKDINNVPQRPIHAKWFGKWVIKSAELMLIKTD